MNDDIKGLKEELGSIRKQLEEATATGVGVKTVTAREVQGPTKSTVMGDPPYRYRYFNKNAWPAILALPDGSSLYLEPKQIVPEKYYSEPWWNELIPFGILGRERLPDTGGSAPTEPVKKVEPRKFKEDDKKKVRGAVADDVADLSKDELTPEEIHMDAKQLKNMPGPDLEKILTRLGHKSVPGDNEHTMRAKLAEILQLDLK